MSDKKINVDFYCKEILWYSTKNEKTNSFKIPIVLDFDFTCTRNSSWINQTWDENPHCFDTLKNWSDLGCVFVLDTMRSGKNLKMALDWLKDNGIEIYGIGSNPDQNNAGNMSHKAWGIFSVDDRNAGSFLVFSDDGRPYIDWEKTDKFLTPILKSIHDRLPELESVVEKEKEIAYSK